MGKKTIGGTLRAKTNCAIPYKTRTDTGREQLYDYDLSFPRDSPAKSVARKKAFG